MNVSGYGKVWNYDDDVVRSQFVGATVDIEEKVDGSQFSAGVIDGVLRMRSKGAEIYPGQGGLFDRADDAAHRMQCYMVPGWTYRFEYLRKPKHNTLCYSRAPLNNLVLLEAESPDYAMADMSKLDTIASLLGVDRTPTIYSGPLPSREDIAAMLDRESFLGGCKIEGVVIKARDRRHNQDGKVLKAKVVSAEFKERHGKEWKSANPGTADIVEQIVAELACEARFEKAVQHAAEDGELERGVRDIGPLMKRLGIDLNDEHSEYVRERLFGHFWPIVARRANAAFPQWYKDRLGKEATA